METTSIKPPVLAAKKDEPSEKDKTESIKALYKLFADELRQIYWSEGALKKVLHKMIKHARVIALENELTDRLAVTKESEERLEQVFKLINEKPETVKSKAVEGLIKEAEVTLDETKKGIVKDTGIISVAFKIDHYKIATYGILSFYARTLGEDGAAELLHKTLVSAKAANEKFSTIIESIKLLH
jgi:ferritin-like metal-binding protein YciE